MAQELTQPFLYDANLVLKSAGLVAANTSETSIDLGGKAGVGLVFIDIDAIETASSDEGYEILIQGSTDDSVWYNLAARKVGAFETIDSETVDTAVGREVLPFRNVRRVPDTANGREQVLRYIRLRTVVEGAIATGINFTAFATMLEHGS